MGAPVLLWAFREQQGARCMQNGNCEQMGFLVAEVIFCFLFFVFLIIYGQ